MQDFQMGGGRGQGVLDGSTEGFILHPPNDHWNKRMGEEITLHSINSAFVVSELLMIYKGNTALLSRTMRAFIPEDILASSN